MKNLSINILVPNTKYYLNSHEILILFFINFVIKFKIDIRKFIYFIYKLLKKNNSYPLFFIKLILIKLLIYIMKFIKTKKYFYKEYKNGRKLRISKKLYLKHHSIEQMGFDEDREIEEILDDGFEYPKSILKKNKNYQKKRVFFNDNKNEVREYFLSSKEKKDKYLEYKKIKRRNNV